MKYFLVLVAATLVGAAIAPSSHAVERRGGTEADHQALSALADRWFEAYAQGDAAAVADIYDPHARIMSEGDVSFTETDGFRVRLEKSFAETTTVFMANWKK